METTHFRLEDNSMDAVQTAAQRLDLAIEIVEKRLGEGSASANAPIVAAVLQSIALDAHSERFAGEFEDLGSTIAQSAAVAAGS